MMSNRLTIKGQVTIPKAVRDFLGLQEGGSSASASPVRSRLQRPTRGFRASAPRAASHCGVLALLAGGI